MMMTESLDAKIRKALEAVPAPDGAPSLAQSKALSAITVVGSRVAFAITVAAERAEQFDSIRRAAEAAVRTVDGVEEVIVALTAEKAVPPKVERSAQRGQGIPGVERIIAVASGKGGVGKSTTAANLALALAGQGLRVGLMDADIYGPSLPTLFNIFEKPEAQGKRLIPHEAFGVKLMSIGFLVPIDTAMIWRGPMVITAVTQLLRDVEWGALDVLVVDMPPGTGDAQLTLCQHVPLAGAVIVSTPQDMALADVRRGVAMFEKVNVPVLGIVENMSYFCCPSCGEKTAIFGQGGAQKEAEERRLPFLGAVPLDSEIRALSDSGKPIVAAMPESHQAAVYNTIAGKLTAILAESNASKMPRIVLD